MGLPKYARQTDVNQKPIVRDLRAVPGVTVEIIGQPVDLAVGFRGRTWMVEIKNPELKLDSKRIYTPRQIRFFATWTGGWIISQSSDEILRTIGAIT